MLGEQTLAQLRTGLTPISFWSGTGGDRDPRTSRYLPAQIQGHRTIDRLDGGGERRGQRKRLTVNLPLMKGRERAIVNQTNTGSKSNVEETSERRGAACMGFSERV